MPPILLGDLPAVGANSNSESVQTHAKGNKERGTSSVPEGISCVTQIGTTGVA